MNGANLVPNACDSWPRDPHFLLQLPVQESIRFHRKVTEKKTDWKQDVVICGNQVSGSIFSFFNECFQPQEVIKKICFFHIIPMSFTNFHLCFGCYMVYVYNPKFLIILHNYPTFMAIWWWTCFCVSFGVPQFRTCLGTAYAMYTVELAETLSVWPILIFLSDFVSLPSHFQG